MSKYKFSPSERYAVFTTHGEKCYLCGTPVDLKSMEVDHIIPEQLLNNKTKLKNTLKSFNLPEDFDLNSFNNWLPACGSCNLRKLSMVFNPTPIIQVELQRAMEKSEKAFELSQKIVNKATITKALNTLERAKKDGKLSIDTINQLEPLIEFHRNERAPELINHPIKLSPNYEVISEKDGIRVIKGPYGVGSGPIGNDVDGSFNCPFCGHRAWNGVRCVICGMMSDD